MIRAWIDLWDRREDPRVLALVRILIAIVLLSDLAAVARFDLPVVLWAPVDAGGLSDVADGTLLFRLFPPTAATARGAFWTLCGATVAFGLGAGTRVAGVVMLLVGAQLRQVMPPADRAIDVLLRNAVLVLVLSSSHRAWSIDALVATRRWSGDGSPQPAWPRHLLVLQLAFMYVASVLHKAGTSWTPIGGWTALYFVLSDPAVARFAPGAWLDRAYPITRVATLSVWLWEWSAAAIPLLYWFRATRTRPGRLRSACNRSGFLRWWVAFGALFHMGIAVTMNLGIFPWGVLALYPVFFHPDELRRLPRAA